MTTRSTLQQLPPRNFMNLRADPTLSRLYIWEIYCSGDEPVWALEARVIEHHEPRERLPGVSVMNRVCPKNKEGEERGGERLWRSLLTTRFELALLQYSTVGRLEAARWTRGGKASAPGSPFLQSVVITWAENEGREAQKRTWDGGTEATERGPRQVDSAKHR